MVDAHTRLVLGCGPHGWRSDAINLDAQDLSPLGIPNFRQVDFVKEGVPFRGEGGWEEVIAEDVIEHLQLRDIGKVLRDLWDYMAVDGRLIIKCPNLETILGEYQTGRINGEEMARLLYGQQNGSDFDCHHWGFTPASLAGMLKVYGFVVVELQARVKDETGRFNNQRVVARKKL